MGDYDEACASVLVERSDKPTQPSQVSAPATAAAAIIEFLRLKKE
jgi:hypothetical protein